MSDIFLYDPMPPVILRHSVNLLAGAPGTGKTAFLVYMVQTLQHRRPFFTLPAATQPIYQAFIGADRSWDDSTRKWFDVQGIDADHFPHYSLQDDRQFQKSRLRKKHERIAIFKECLDKVSPEGTGIFPTPSLIYVDPLALFLGGNLLDYDTCLVACSELREICIDKGICIVGTAHAAKQKADKKETYLRLQDRILGSAALFGYTDTQLYLASPEETDRSTYTFLWAPHHAKSQMFAMTRDEEGRFVPVDNQPLESTAAAGKPPKALADVDWLLTLLAEPKKATELVEVGAERSVSRMTVYRRLNALCEQGRVKQVSRGVYQVVTVS
jgi:hypothetical protein